MYIIIKLLNLKFKIFKKKYIFTDFPTAHFYIWKNSIYIHHLFLYQHSLYMKEILNTIGHRRILISTLNYKHSLSFSCLFRVLISQCISILSIRVHSLRNFSHSRLSFALDWKYFQNGNHFWYGARRVISTYNNTYPNSKCAQTRYFHLPPERTLWKTFELPSSSLLLATHMLKVFNYISSLQSNPISFYLFKFLFCSWGPSWSNFIFAWAKSRAARVLHLQPFVNWIYRHRSTAPLH